jgi:drug/metabolite transporter (DMT)-like permease
MVSRKSALTFALLSTCFSSISVLFHNIAAKELPLFQALAGSHVLGGLGLLLFIMLRREKIKWHTVNNHRLDLFMVLMCRFLVGAIILWYAHSLTTAMKAMFFSKIEPYLILILNWLIDGSKVPRTHLILLFFHLVGVGLLSNVSLHEFGAANIGDCLFILAMFIYACSYRFAARLSSGVSTLSLTMIVQLASGIIFIPIALYQTPLAEWTFIGPGWEALYMTVIFWSYLGLPFWFIALQGLPGWLVSALRAVGPILAAPIAIIFFNQSLNAVQWSGAILILATSFLLAREKKMEQKS